MRSMVSIAVGLLISIGPTASFSQTAAEMCRNMKASAKCCMTAEEATNYQPYIRKMCSGGATAARYAKETNDLREYTKAVDAARAAQQQEENNQVMGEIVGGFLTGFVGGVAGGAMRAPMTGAAAGVVMHPIIRPAIAAPRSVSVTRVNVRPNATVGTHPTSVAVVPKQPTSSTSSTQAATSTTQKPVASQSSASAASGSKQRCAALHTQILNSAVYYETNPSAKAADTAQYNSLCN